MLGSSEGCETISLRMKMFRRKSQVWLFPAEFHSLSYHELMSNGSHGSFQRVVDGYVDDVHFVQYHSRTNTTEARQEWMTRLTEEHTERQMNTWADDLQVQTLILEEAMQRPNLTTGAHWVQRISRCMWDDETGEVIGHHRFAYDGKYFLGFHLQKKQWVALTAEAETIIGDLNRRVTLNQRVHDYLTQDCPERLQMYLQYGSSQLLRKVPPKVFLLQKNSSSPIVCLATAFFPKHCELFWREDGEVLSGDDVLMTDTLPNHDGTFQRKAELLRPPVRPEDLSQYECVFQSYGQDDVTLRLDEGLKRNPGQISPTTIVLIILICSIAIFVIGALVFCLRSRNHRPSERCSHRFSRCADTSQIQESSAPSEDPCHGEELQQLRA
ncbi:class I histocompatibility antigen, Gogo-A*0501 alpha chain-like [Synchiropus splendidus]|uniref:class I histocompatibility antigen, Gogo-A*0501 alpha chain-like n=1 Tax=Synchiropus splendidus TaxID=270530 RepID=UPI00237E3E81|nr:class I histocompatibility antigen, Gogo-A*0501 alpha chain-like [Synchiropus splendidus]